MAENTIKKYLDQAGLEALVGQIKTQDTKTLEAAKKYTDDAAKNYEAAGSVATALGEAKSYTDEKVGALADGQVNTNKEAIAGIVADYLKAADKTELQGNIDALANGQVKTNKEAIEAINNESTGILAQAKAYADGKDADIEAAQKAGDDAQDAVDALAAKVGTVPEGSTVMGIITNIQENAYDDTAIRGLITDLDTNKADKTKVAEDIAAAVKAETDARVEAVKAVQDELDEFEGTYATDKKALEDAIALKADQTALDAVSEVANAAVKQSDYDVKVKALEDEDARIAGLVSDEVAKAREEEGKLDARLVEVEAFFKTTEEETLDTALDTLVELQKYLEGEGAVADQMVLDIAANKKAIEDHVATDHDFAAADATLKAELEGKIDAKADSSVVEGVAGRVTTAEGKITTIEGKLADIEDSADANVIEVVKVNGEALTVTDKAVDITVPTGALANKNEVAEADLEAALATKLNAKADQATLESEVATLVAADDAIKGRLDSLEAIDHDHSNKAELDLIATGDKAKWDEAYAKRHEHANKDLLDTYTQTEANLADAVAKKHEHANATVLDGITADKVTAWDAAEKNAKDYADGLNSAMTTKVDGIDTRLQAAEGAVATKAEQEDLDDAVERIAANETAIAANASAIAAFSAISVEDVEKLFA